MVACTRCNTEFVSSLTACPSCGEMTTEFLRRHSVEPLDGKYQLLSVLGIGGMGEVYKAMHVHLHAMRVIKLMRPSIAGEKDAHERFLREARLATRIQHPNVAALYDFSALPDGSFYMVWEYIDGTNLQKFVRERQFLRPNMAVRLGVQALQGLEAIHRAGIVHRDISPENLMVTRDEQGLDRLKIIDLGVAKQWNDPQEEQTRSGIFVGKFRYCSPEQLGLLKAGERIDGRSDIYSFGLVLYEMLTGVAPFQAETPHEYLVLHSSRMPQPLRQANPQAIVPPQLEALVFRALAKNREARFNTALEFAEALQNALPSLPEAVYPATIVAEVPVAESVADVPLPLPSPATVVRADQPKRSGMVDTASGRSRDLYEQVIAAMGEEQYGRADVALQTMRMHLGARSETDGNFRRVRKELETAATEKDTWFAGAIERAKQEGKPKEVQRLLAEREEKLGRRFGNPAVKLEGDLWLRRRSELLAKARSWTAAESFNNAGHVLDELAAHLENGASFDEEYLALQQGFQQAIVAADETMRREIVGAHAQENIGKTRRLLAMYEAKFGHRTRKDAPTLAAEAWIRDIDALRARDEPKGETTAVRRVKKGRRGRVVVLVVILLLLAGVFAVHRWNDQTADLVRRYTSGEVQKVLLDGVRAVR